MTTEEQQRRHDINMEHARDPKVGDYWHEMLSPVTVVRAIINERIVLFEKPIWSSEEGCYMMGTENNDFAVKTIPEFTEFLTYDSIKDKTWCDVVPEKYSIRDSVGDE